MKSRLFERSRKSLGFEKYQTDYVPPPDFIVKLEQIKDKGPSEYDLN